MQIGRCRCTQGDFVVVARQRSRGDEGLSVVVGCSDGVWDHLGNDELIGLVSRYIKEGISNGNVAQLVIESVVAKVRV